SLNDLNVLVKLYFKNHPCKVAIAPFDVYLTRDGILENAKSVLQPDLCIICDESKIDLKVGCIGAPDLIVEVLSPSTSKKDWNDKFNLYQEFGVKEYWIVSPEAKTIHVFTLEDGKYTEFGIYEKDAKFCGKLFPDMEIALDEVFKF
ncbi:MAG: Uma2 family endonuclease, partial [Bacteroidia bacterium]